MVSKLVRASSMGLGASSSGSLPPKPRKSLRFLAALAADLALARSLRLALWERLAGAAMARSRRLSVSRSLSMESLTKADSSLLDRKWGMSWVFLAAVARPVSRRRAQANNFI